MTAGSTISLAGRWRVALDAYRCGIRLKWFMRELPRARCRGSYRDQPSWINLPGTTDESGLGEPFQPGPSLSNGLDRRWNYDGGVFLQRFLTIPRDWEGRRVVLFLERTQWASKAWLDGESLGEDASFATPHVYDLTRLATPGEHRLTLWINNSRPNGFGGHHIVPGGGANWNGIVGRIELQATPPVWMDDVQAYPDIHARAIRLRARIGNITGKAGRGAIGIAGHAAWPVEWGPEGGQAETTVPLPEAPLWDEFAPCVQELWLRLGEHERSVRFGLREFSTEGTQFTLNGRRLFLRGTHEGCSFPLTAYPPTDPSAWQRIFRTVKEYGLNHVRFHSWCPPEAAFQAADELGVLLQVELGGGHSTEVRRILDAYGNHPSFALMTWGNELFTHRNPVAQAEPCREARWGSPETPVPSGHLLKMARAHDPRHLYSCTSHPWAPGCCDDFYVSAWGPDEKPTVGIQWGGGDVQSTTRFNTRPPETASDYREAIAGIDRPLLSHEAGQWASYPGLAELPRYSGVLRNHNYELICAHLRERGLLPQAADFAKASGRLALLLYQEEIESALRTPGFGGFQLLDLHDYPGQGVSTVGILDSFWESKGLIAPERFREFCSPTVPLLRLHKRIWTDSETLEATAGIAHYGTGPLRQIRPEWRLCDAGGQTLAGGGFPVCDLPTGGLTTLGRIQVALGGFRTPARLVVQVAVEGTAYRNQWDIWVYPAVVPIETPPGVTVAAQWSSEVAEKLDRGATVLLLPESDAGPDPRPGCFTPVFWNPVHKPDQPAKTHGLLCDPAHPLFNDFPTEPHTNWQWWELLMPSRVMNVTGLGPGVRPLVQAIDTYTQNETLALAFECRVGSGRLLVCSINLRDALDRRPVARQFLRSLYGYVAGGHFQPGVRLDSSLLESWFGAGRNGAVQAPVHSSCRTLAAGE